MAKSSGTRGKQFEQDLMRTLINAGGWAEKIPDKLVFRGPDLPAMSVAGPPDIVAVVKGRPYLIECKACNIKNAKSITFDRVKPHQLDSLLEFYEAGGEAYVAVLWYGTTNASPSTKAFLIPVKEWWNAQVQSKKKSINISEVEEMRGSVQMRWLGRSKEGAGPWTMRA